MTSPLAQDIAAALREAAPPPVAPISQAELSRYTPEQRQAFAAVLSQHGFAKADVAKVAPPAEAPAAPVPAIDAAPAEGYRLRYASEVLSGPDVAASDAAIRGGRPGNRASPCSPRSERFGYGLRHGADDCQPSQRRSPPSVFSGSRQALGQDIRRGRIERAWHPRECCGSPSWPGVPRPCRTPWVPFGARHRDACRARKSIPPKTWRAANLISELRPGLRFAAPLKTRRAAPPGEAGKVFCDGFPRANFKFRRTLQPGGKSAGVVTFGAALRRAQSSFGR
jgi:hypothetical protein